jgi:hypothetical protein
MTSPPTPPDAEAPGGDPWAAFGYLVAGVAFYGVIGWLLSVWLNATYWIPIGILVGAGFGLYLVFARFRLATKDVGAHSVHVAKSTPAPSEPPTPIDDDAEPDEPAP